MGFKLRFAAAFNNTKELQRVLTPLGDTEANTSASSYADESDCLMHTIALTSVQVQFLAGTLHIGLSVLNFFYQDLWLFLSSELLACLSVTPFLY